MDVNSLDHHVCMFPYHETSYFVFQLLPKNQWAEKFLSNHEINELEIDISTVLNERKSSTQANNWQNDESDNISENSENSLSD